MQQACVEHPGGWLPPSLPRQRHCVGGTVQETLIAPSSYKGDNTAGSSGIQEQAWIAGQHAHTDSTGSWAPFGGREVSLHKRRMINTEVSSPWQTTNKHNTTHPNNPVCRHAGKCMSSQHRMHVNNTHACKTHGQEWPCHERFRHYLGTLQTPTSKLKCNNVNKVTVCLL